MTDYDYEIDYAFEELLYWTRFMFYNEVPFELQNGVCDDYLHDLLCALEGDHDD